MSVRTESRAGVMAADVMFFLFRRISPANCAAIRLFSFRVFHCPAGSFCPGTDVVRLGDPLLKFIHRHFGEVDPRAKNIIPEIDARPENDQQQLVYVSTIFKWSKNWLNGSWDIDRRRAIDFADRGGFYVTMAASDVPWSACEKRRTPLGPITEIEAFQEGKMQ